MTESLADVSVAILAGGLGTRLRPVLADRPKVLAPIVGRPFAAYLLDQLATAGATDVVLCTGFMAEAVEAALGDRHGPMRLHYAREAMPLGTGGAIRSALEFLPRDTLLILNGDSYCPVDYSSFHRRHRERGAHATLLLVHQAETGRFGQVQLDAAGQVTAFAEKRPGGGPGWINAGVYLIERALLAEAPAHQPLSLERDLFPAWIGRGLYGDTSGSALLDIGTPESLAEAEAFLREQGLC